MTRADLGSCLPTSPVARNAAVDMGHPWWCRLKLNEERFFVGPEPCLDGKSFHVEQFWRRGKSALRRAKRFSG
jgi:hypothetical protein